MLCPIVSASTIAFAPDTFSAISCLPIASLLPSSDMPKLLAKINHVLAPGGLLHIVLIDPSPPTTTTTNLLGPRLRQWLDERLLFNLELQFRATRPSRFFPIWLEEAKLRGPGSIITQTRFPAVVAGEEDVNKELRCTAGRLLWQQVWGPFVLGGEWWWDVPEIVDECRERGTFWEYSVIAACKAL